MDKSLGIVIPVYNEAPNIEATITEIEYKVKSPYQIYIVYDFDEDDTLPVVKKLIDGGLDIKLIKNPVRGVVNAIKTGLREAVEGFLLVTMADLSDDYDVVDEMVALMSGGYDVVCGSRYMKGGKQLGGPIIKKTISRLAGVSLWYLAGLPTHDATNSFKLYRKTMLDAITIESNGGFEIGIELVTKAHVSGYKVTELPCIWNDRELGKSRFQIIKWAPKYLKWYFYGFKKRFFS